jgi:DNA-binding MarR family transcriptional regulator
VVPAGVRDARGRLTGSSREWFVDRPPVDESALRPSERRVAEALGALLPCGEGRPGVARIAERAGVAYAATSRALAKLESLGLIGRERRYNASKRDRFWLVIP